MTALDLNNGNGIDESKENCLWIIASVSVDDDLFFKDCLYEKEFMPLLLRIISESIKNKLKKIGCVVQAASCALSNLLYRHFGNVREFLNNDGINVLLQLLNSGLCDLFSVFCIISCFASVARLAEALPLLKENEVFRQCIDVVHRIYNMDGPFACVSASETSNPQQNKKVVINTKPPPSSTLALPKEIKDRLDVFLKRCCYYQKLLKEYQKSGIPRAPDVDWEESERGERKFREEESKRRENRMKELEKVRKEKGKWDLNEELKIDVKEDVEEEKSEKEVEKNDWLKEKEESFIPLKRNNHSLTPELSLESAVLFVVRYLFIRSEFILVMPEGFIYNIYIYII
jgi:hypothetical protein